MARHTDYRSLHISSESTVTYKQTYEFGYYAAQWRLLELPLLESLFKNLYAQGSRSMLDIACGQGRITLLGAVYFDDVIGIDYSQQMLSVAQQHRVEDSRLKTKNVQFVIGDVRDFAVRNPFDVVTAFRFFLNTQDELRINGLRCVRRNLALHGTFITNIHVAGGSPLAMFYKFSNSTMRLFGRPPNRVRNSMSLRAFRDLLTQEGFEITNVYRYSLLPRVSTLTDSFAENHIGKIDRLSMAVPGMQLLCQSFIVCARLKQADLSHF